MIIAEEKMRRLVAELDAQPVRRSAQDGGEFAESAKLEQAINLSVSPELFRNRDGQTLFIDARVIKSSNMATPINFRERRRGITKGDGKRDRGFYLNKRDRLTRRRRGEKMSAMIA